MKTITFYSYKGGVGRSLALSNIANRLSEFGKRVCLLDFDLEAPGLHHKFKSHIGLEDIKMGIVDYIIHYQENKRPPDELLPFVSNITFDPKKQASMELIAAGNVNSELYWKNLARINWSQLFLTPESQGVELFVDLKQKIEEQLSPDFLLIDSRTGITEISGITMSILADEVVILAANNDENIEGTKQIIKTLCAPGATFMCKPPKITVVLSRIPYFSNPEEKIIETKIKNSVKRKIETYLNSNGMTFLFQKLFLIHSDPDLEVEETFKMGYDHEKGAELISKAPIATDYLELFEELTAGSLSEQEMKRFNNIIQAELLLKEATYESNPHTRIKILSQAIKLNPKSDDVYYSLANAYIVIEELAKADEIIDAALHLPPSKLNEFLFLRAWIFMEQKSYEKAELLYRKVLESSTSHFGALSNLARIHYLKRDYTNALELYRTALDRYPDEVDAYNSVANTLRLMGRYDEALEFVYKGLAINPKHAVCTGTLAEIYAALGNLNEFYKNLELSFSFGISDKAFNRIVREEAVYRQFLSSERFHDILSKYNITIVSTEISEESSLAENQ